MLLSGHWRCFAIRVQAMRHGQFVGGEGIGPVSVGLGITNRRSFWTLEKSPKFVGWGFCPMQANMGQLKGPLARLWGSLRGRS